MIGRRATILQVDGQPMLKSSMEVPSALMAESGVLLLRLETATPGCSRTRRRVAG